jgi:hypothetical protein
MEIDDEARLHEERAADAARAADNGTRRAEAARRRAAAARARGDAATAAFHEDVAEYQDRHHDHEERHRAFELAMAAGESVRDFERRTGWEPETYAPPVPKPPTRAPGDGAA